jgi:protein-tyrosine phosphatase
MIDVHSHILPGIDDGPDTLEETINMLSIASEEGIKVVAATHHFLDDKMSVDSYLKLWKKRMQQVKLTLEKANIDISIVRGAEVMISPSLPMLEGIERLCINGSRYMLIELPMLNIPLYVEEVIYILRLKGIISIIAHPERNKRIVEDPNLLYPLVELGALCQVNTGNITGLYGENVKRCARILIDHNMAHLLGTDAHSTGRRSPRIKEAMAVLYKWTSSPVIDRMLHAIPGAVLKNDFIEVESPVFYRKRRFFSFPRFT